MWAKEVMHGKVTQEMFLTYLAKLADAFGSMTLEGALKLIKHKDGAYARASNAFKVLRQAETGYRNGRKNIREEPVVDPFNFTDRTPQDVVFKSVAVDAPKGSREPAVCWVFCDISLRSEDREYGPSSTVLYLPNGTGHTAIIGPARRGRSPPGERYCLRWGLQTGGDESQGQARQDALEVALAWRRIMCWK